MFREKCLICNSEELIEIINLGMHPFADSFIPESKLSEADSIYPLICDLCTSCGQVQTRCETDPKLRYSDVEYSYTSSNSKFSRTHWEDYEKEVSSFLNLQENSLIVEAGSNDGYLIEQFQKNGMKVIGVDPSHHMAELAKQRKIETIVDLFNKESAEKILEKYGKSNLVIANNVLNHSNNPLEFVRSVEIILSEKGYFVFEQPYWLSEVKSGKFDQIYHEHVNYFTVKSLSELLSRAGLAIRLIKIVDYHGGSLRIVAQKKDNIIKEPEEVKKLIEEEFDLFKLETYKKFMQQNLLLRSKFLQKIHKIKEEGNPIIAIGAAAKGNTFLNFYKLDNTIIDYVTDTSPYKKGKFTPSTRIPIVGDEILSNYNKPYALILSWNIANQIKEILNKINPNINFLIPEELD